MLVLACLTPAPDQRGLASISGTGKRGGNYTDAGQQGRLDQSSSPLCMACRVVVFFRLIRMPFTGPLPPSAHDLTPQKGSPRHGEPAFAGCVWGVYAYLQSLFFFCTAERGCFGHVRGERERGELRRNQNQNWGCIGIGIDWAALAQRVGGGRVCLVLLSFFFFSSSPTPSLET
ncbi:hypothetical protein LX32DRAFT_305009 [Colletotrichum zoysiae]|uniref:Uncharacterized protein n=1 Tax=Colletotrichum zoysiae TaxID=1216348 RepID=A0AAD9H327_9PEZI|nr:hypothetical protein LX32DRAFT_305009 [Colletotrichum zoysiae]